jgi:hypothetical protein
MPPAASIFSYNVTRPFPFPWFTWAVLASGTILTVLFTFVAVASNAYELDSVYTTDCNNTEGRQEWYSKPPFAWFNSLEAKCQPNLLTVGASYKTSNRGFVYSLSGIQNGSGLIPAVAYKSAPLRGCDVEEIRIAFVRTDNTRLPMNYWAWGGSFASVRHSLPFSRYSMNMTARRRELTNSVAVGYACVPVKFPFRACAIKFHGRATTSSRPRCFWFNGKSAREFSLPEWLGECEYVVWYAAHDVVVWQTFKWYDPSAWTMRLLSPPRRLTCSIAMGYSTPYPTGEEAWGTGSVPLTRNSNSSDYTDPTFFVSGASFSTDQGGLHWMGFNSTIANWTNEWASPESLYGLPNISLSVDAFGKSFYSLLLSDFGVETETNALNSVAGVQYLQSRNDTDLVTAAAELGKTESGTVSHVLASNTPDQRLSSSNTTTTLFTQYLCSVPQKKSGMSLLLPILLADIVFLQTCWTVFKFVMSWWLAKKDTKANYCEGCMAAEKAKAAVVDEISSRPATIRSSSRPDTIRSYSGYQTSEAQELLPVYRVDESNGVFLR